MSYNRVCNAMQDTEQLVKQNGGKAPLTMTAFTK
jgi:hypothetical protein